MGLALSVLSVYSVAKMEATAKITRRRGWLASHLAPLIMRVTLRKSGGATTNAHFSLPNDKK